MTNPRAASDLPLQRPGGDLDLQLCEIWSEVLGRPVRDVSATFTDMGTSSLLAAMAAARIYDRLGVHVDLTTIFRSRTIRALASSIERASGPAAGTRDVPLVASPSRLGLPMSFFQEWRFRADEGRPAPQYTIALGYELHGDLRIDAMRDAISELARRHEPLRTNYDITAAGAIQQIHPASAAELPVLDFRESAEDLRRADALRVLKNAAAQPLDRRTGNVFQPMAARLADDRYLLMLRLDRIAVDGTSCEILETELGMLYARFADGRDAPDPPALQQADWASWQRQLLRTPRLAGAVDYWRRTLDGTRPLLELRLPSGLRSPRAPGLRGRSASRKLGTDLSGIIRRRAREADVTLFMYVLAAVNTFIARLAAQDIVTILSPFANRTRPELERMVGCLAHGVIYRTDLSGAPSFNDVVARVRDVCLGAWQHQELPISEVARHVRPVSYLTLYDEFHVFCDLIRDQPSLRIAGVDVAPEEIGTGAAHPSLAILVDDGTENLGLIMRADADRFDDSALQWCMREFSRLIDAAAREPEQRISLLPPAPDLVRQRFGST